GVGIGRFAVESPTARSDADARWAHDEFLQVGAEAGIPAMALMIAIFLWAVVRLTATRRVRWGVAIGAAAVAALGVHASIDYVLHFPAVGFVAAGVLGSAVAIGERRRASWRAS